MCSRIILICLFITLVQQIMLILCLYLHDYNLIFLINYEKIKKHKMICEIVAILN
jgi:hypothetical protein